jgi:hypothetical protein
VPPAGPSNSPALDAWKAVVGLIQSPMAPREALLPQAALFLFACAITLQALTTAVVYVARPLHLTAGLWSPLDGAADDPVREAVVEMRLRQVAGQRVLGGARARILALSWSVLVWWLVSLLMRAGRGSVKAVFSAVCLASVVTTVAFVVHQSAAAVVGHQLPSFSLAGFVPVGTSMSTWLGRIDVASLCWATVAGAQLAVVWKRSVRTSVITVVGLTTLWALAAHGH